MITVKIFLFTLVLLCSVKQSSGVTEEEFQVSIPCQRDYFLNPRGTRVVVDKLILILITRKLSSFKSRIDLYVYSVQLKNSPDNWQVTPNLACPDENQLAKLRFES